MSANKFTGNTERKVLNTTINGKTLDTFKQKCRDDGITMSTVLELFMRAYLDGDIYMQLQINKDNKK